MFAYPAVVLPFEHCNVMRHSYLSWPIIMDGP